MAIRSEFSMGLVEAATIGTHPTLSCSARFVELSLDFASLILFSMCGLTPSDIERIQSQRTQSKLPNLTIYDLLEEGFKTEPEKEPFIRHIKSEPDHYTHYTKHKHSDGLRCTSQDIPTRGLPNVGPRFGLLDDRKLARRVGNEFPGFFKLASHIDPISWNETENIIPIEKPEKERKIGKSISFIFLTKFYF